MIFHETTIEGAYVVDPEPIGDERGFFARLWSRDEFVERGMSGSIVQCSMSYNARAGTLRGMHWQAPPHEEAKLVRCVRGAIYDVIADARTGSATADRWYGVELSAENRRLLYVPPYVAHGFQTLTDDVEVFYAMSGPYVPDAARGFRWDDPAFAIEWPAAEDRVIAERDRSWPPFTLPGRPARSGEAEP